MDTGSLLYIGVLVLAFYLLLIRPQQQRQKQQRELIAALSVGDRIITIGGLHGTVVSVRDEIVRIRVADNSELEFEKTAIAKITVDIPELGEDESPASSGDSDS
jgi:preprotein translocase subunit YajC